jgi:hypothetical protein
MKQIFRRNLVAVVAVLAALGVVFVVPAANATARHRHHHHRRHHHRRHHPTGAVKLSSIKFMYVKKVLCGQLNGTWLPGSVSASGWFVSDAQQQINYLAMARHAHGKKKKKLKAAARVWGNLANSLLAICTPSTPGSSLPSMGSEPGPSLFGIDTGTYDSSKANFVNDFPTSQGLGARWDHIVLGPKTGTGDYATIDYEVEQVRKHGMGVVLSFGGISGACSQSVSNVASCPPTTATDLSNYQNYVEQILERYHNVVSYYESWVEPNHGSQWAGTANPAQYAALLQAEYEVFQQFNIQNPGSGPGGSDMKLLFGSPNGFTIAAPSPNQPDQNGDIAALQFTEQTLNDIGGAKAFDGVALHAYRYPADAGPNTAVSDWVQGLSNMPTTCTQSGQTQTTCRMTWTDELNAYEQEFTAHGYGQPPMWLLEFGWPGVSSSSMSSCTQLNPAGYCPDETTQGQFLQQAYADLLNLPFVQAAFWFNLRNYQPGAASPDPNFFFYYGLLEYDYTHKPAADAFTALAHQYPNR